MQANKNEYTEKAVLKDSLFMYNFTYKGEIDDQMVIGS